MGPGIVCTARAKAMTVGCAPLQQVLRQMERSLVLG